MALTRVLQASDTDLTVRFYVDGVATDADGDVDVTIVAIDGTPVVTDTATSTGTDGEYFYTLSAANTADLNLLKVTWTATIGGLAQTVVEYAEVVGGFLFSLAEARDLDPLGDPTEYPDEKIADVRTRLEVALERAVGFAFVPRYALETLSPQTASYDLRLSGYAVRSVRTVNGEPAPDVQVYNNRYLNSPSYWPVGVANTVVGYEHGWDYPPPDVSAAALLQARSWLIDGPIDDRATSMSTEDGTFTLLTPSVRGVRFDVPEMQAVVNDYRVNRGGRGGFVSVQMTSG